MATLLLGPSPVPSLGGRPATVASAWQVQGPKANPRLTVYRARPIAGLYGDSATVHVDFRTCDVGRFIGSQKQNGIRYLVYFSWPAHGYEAHTFGTHGGIGGATRGAHRRHDPGMNRVGADLVLRVLHRDRLSH